jgi:response regulator RpfG family c-di-GMP phosphodiesterase
MPGRLFLFQWDDKAEARAQALRAAGWTVEVESSDGARGCRAILNNPPDMILLDLARRPSHSRATAEAIHRFKASRRIPMLFIDGTELEVAKVKAAVLNPLFTPSELLLHRLSKLDD